MFKDIFLMELWNAASKANAEVCDQLDMPNFEKMRYVADKVAEQIWRDGDAYRVRGVHDLRYFPENETPCFFLQGFFLGLAAAWSAGVKLHEPGKPEQ